MEPSIAKDRPSYVVFERREVEDRNATIVNGRYTPKEIDIAIVTPMGSKDRYEKPAKDWLEGLEQMVREERLPREWLNAYKQSYEAFCQGQEIPVTGTPIRTWPVLSPAQIRLVTSWNILTVEDLAQANEDAIRQLGMGGRALVERARAWLETAGSPQAKNAEQLAALQAQVKMLIEQNQRLEEQNKALAAKKTAA